MDSEALRDISDVDTLLAQRELMFDMQPASMTRQHDISQMPRGLDVDFSDGPGGANTGSADYIALLLNQGEMRPEASDEDRSWDTFSNHILRDFSPPAQSNIDDRVEQRSFNSTSNKAQVPSRQDTPVGNDGRITIPASPTPVSSKRRHPRRQNHSCDQCRSSKKACDLPLDVHICERKPSTACTACNIRGLGCTVSWLARKKMERAARKRVRRSAYITNRNEEPESCPTPEKEEDVNSDVSQPLATSEVNLVKQLTARETCRQLFNLYVDVCDMNLSQCLLQECMPPRYSLGIAALTPLSDSSHPNIYMEKAHTWIQSCWDMNSTSWSFTTAAPHIFGTVSLLDSLFQESSFHPSSSFRDVSINEAYKWVAMATATQFAVASSRTNDEQVNKGDLTYATWRKAKQMVFKHMAVTDSFRQSLSLTLFGLILPPPNSIYGDNPEEDSKYALCEGLRRLQALCTKAQGYVQGLNMDYAFIRPTNNRKIKNLSNAFHALPSTFRENVSELIGAIEWLTTMANTVTIAISHGKICPIPLNTYDSNDRDLHITHNMAQLPERDNRSLPLSFTELKGQEDDDLILLRAKAEEQTAMKLWCEGVSDERLDQAFRRSGSLLIVFWKSLASLTLARETIQSGNADYDDLHWRYKRTMMLVKLWRSNFGTFDDSTTSCLHHALPSLRRMVTSCLNDGELAVLLFYDICHKLEAELANLPSTPAKDELYRILCSEKTCRKEQRLLSAIQISTFASVSQGMASPGLQEGGGLKAYVQDNGAHAVSICLIDSPCIANVD